MPKVLVSDKLSETAVQIFRDRGVEVDYLPDLGKDKEKLAEVIGQYDGLAIRSATKVTEKLLQNATNLKVIGRAGIGVDNVDIPAASKKGVIVMNTPFGNSVTTAEHAIAMMFAVARQLPEAELVVCPGLAANLAGDRLGRGGGWYDRALAHAGQATPVLVLLNRDEVLPAIPVQPWDRRVDRLVTPDAVIECDPPYAG